MRVVMNFKKTVLLEAILIILIPFISFPGFSQIREGKIESFWGKVWNVSGDYSFLIINEQRLDLNADTKVLDQEGKVLSRYSLKPAQSVFIEAEYRSGNYQIKKIVIQTGKTGKP